MNYEFQDQQPFEPVAYPTPDQILDAPTDGFPLQPEPETAVLDHDLAIDQLAAESVASVLGAVRQSREGLPPEAHQMFPHVVVVPSANINNQIRAANRRSDVDLGRAKPGSLSRRHAHYKKTGI